MWYGCGAEAVMAKIANIENMNVWFHSCGEVLQWHTAALQNLFRAMEWFEPLPYGLQSGKWAWSAFPSFFVLFVTLDSNQQLPKFQRAGSCDEGQLQKTELKLYETVVSTMFRLLFNAIVQPKVLLFWLPFSIFFPCRGSIAISSAHVWKWPKPVSIHMAPWLFFSRIKTKKKRQKNWKRAASMDSRSSFITCGSARCLSLPLPHCRYGFTGLGNANFSHRPSCAEIWVITDPWCRDCVLHTFVHLPKWI